MNHHRLRTAGLVLGALTLSLAVSAAPAGAQDNPPPPAAAAPAGGTSAGGDPNDPANQFRRASAQLLRERLPLEKAAVIKLDSEIYSSIGKKAVSKLDEDLDLELKVLSTAIAGPRRWLDKDQFISKVKAGKPISGKLVDLTLKGIFAAESDVAVVTGFIQNPGETSPSLAYSSVYLRLHDQWQMANYMTTPISGKPTAAKGKPVSLVKPWSESDLSITQARVFGVLRSFTEASASHDKAKLEQILGPTFWYIDGANHAVERTKAAYITDSAAWSGTYTLENPEVTLVGDYGDIGVITALRKPKDGAGGEAHVMAVLRRQNLMSDVWFLDHFQATPVQP